MPDPLVVPSPPEPARAPAAAVQAAGARLDPGPASDAALALAREAGLSFTAADVLHRRGWQSGALLERWLDPKLTHLTAPSEMADLELAAERIARAIRNRERIAVFGDYDCDGITSCAITTEVVRALGGEAVPLLANRFAGGYGFSQPALERVRETGASLLITCDCGSSDHERLESARRTGIDSVVIDHHLVPEERLPALAFLNPHRPECGFPFKGLASCGLALIVATALRRKLNAALDVRAWLDLVAVGTIADVAPLEGDNRVLVRRGLEWLSHGQRVGLRALAVQGAGGRVRPVGAEDVAYQVAPRINAPGRLGDPRLALEVLLATHQARAWELAARIEDDTLRRRELQRRITSEAIAGIDAAGYHRDPALVLADPGWHPGIVGIVAGRLAELYEKPTVVIALEGASGRGSARAPAGFRLYDALAACRDALLGFGGHQAAAGVEVAASQVDAFRDAFCQATAQQLADTAPPLARPLAEARVDERDDLRQLAGDLERLEPCGHKNPAPKLLLTGVTVAAARPVQEHLKLELVVRGQRLGAFAPGMAERLPREGATLDVVGRVRRDHFRGGDALEVLVEALGVNM